MGLRFKDGVTPRSQSQYIQLTAITTIKWCQHMRAWLQVLLDAINISTIISSYKNILQYTDKPLRLSEPQWLQHANARGSRCLLVAIQCVEC